MRTAFVDVDTQIDFMFPAGALYVPGAEKILPEIARLNRWAAEHGIPVISTMDAHAENDAEFSAWPPHCVAGTLGQRKPECTLVAGQRFVRKQALDCFTSGEMEPALRETGAERYVVYGVVTEFCVRHAALGLLARGGRVEVVTSAILHIDEASMRTTFDEIVRRGGVLRTAGEVCAG
ncbi:MAG: cysteine hydrolase [Bryobacteraceae bacterium]|nr:cysteine hydrolase [Bryobacteraceae bacterium]